MLHHGRAISKRSAYLYLSLISSGDFSGGGAIAVECSPLLVAEVETRGRLGKVDGRFPHWVTPYSGNRFSLIYVSCLIACQINCLLNKTSYAMSI